MRISLAPSGRDEAIAALEKRWAASDLMGRVWRKDPTVWSQQPQPEIDNRLGWLDLPTTASRHFPEIDRLADIAIAEGIRHVVLCGMGGSSLAPEVFSNTHPAAADHPILIVCDSTHPDALSAITASIDIAKTWFVISSKSGTTLETLSFMRYFWKAASESLSSPSDHFIAVTDPDSTLAHIASEREFRSMFLADPNVGGRYSALSAFGLVPAGLIGCDIRALVSAGAAAASLCGPETPLMLNPGFTIGATMAVAAGSGQDKVRFVGAGVGVHVGAWVEQLIAESTGKDGRGIVPIDGGPPRIAADDEIVVSLGSRTVGESAEEFDVVIEFEDAADVGAVMFLLELATAVAGEIIGINPFNQPDVQRAKTLAIEAMEAGTDEAIPSLSIRSPDISVQLTELLAPPRPSYVAIQAFLAPSNDTTTALRALRNIVTSRTGAATTIGYGPRFLHSTGQLHKGGQVNMGEPHGARFIQVVDTPTRDIEVPEAGFSFGRLITAQASGDLTALTDIGRRVVSIDLGEDPVAGLIGLANAARIAGT